MKTFEQIRQEINVYSAVDDNRMRVLHDKVLETAHIPAAMCEVGVYKGGSAYMIANSNPKRIFFAFDTFEGLPAIGQEDLVNGKAQHTKGDFSDTSLESVKEFLKDCDNVILYKGLFPRGIPPKFSDEKFSFVHIDVDLYEPTLDCLKFFWPRMLEGGIIVSDDYKWKATPGVERAFNEFFGPLNIQVNDTGVNSCWVKKE